VRFRTILALALISLVASSTAASDFKSKIGFGLRGPVFAPIIKGKSYAKFSGSYEPFMMGWAPSFEFKFGAPRRFIVNLAIGYSSTYDDYTATTDQSFKLNKKDHAYSKLTGVSIGLTGQYYFLPEGSVQPYILLGGGVDMWSIKTRAMDTQNPQIPIGSTYKFNDLGGKGGIGISFWILDNLALDLQGRMTYIAANLSTSGTLTSYGDLAVYKYRPFTAYIEPSIGLTYFIGGAADSDHDGVKDKFDQCPDTPKGATVDQYGCPLDSDGDGVYDGIDQCPDTPKGCVVDITGCPLDTDMDGVCDGLDKCPDSPAGVAVDVNGCPLDSDADGVPDYKDQQSNTPKGAVVDSLGVAIDSDGDGVPDGIDKCPDTPASVLVDEFGCPKAKALKGKMILNIRYQSGSFEPDEAAKAVLDELVLTLEAYPKLNIEVNGYTDALGSNSGNLKLSKKRADAVKDYLVSKGVAAERIKAQGFGEANPVADNGTDEGRLKNRRIEIVPVQ
jgi:outer membrane protein OmpA-like peptidoglycan-associated protein